MYIICGYNDFITVTAISNLEMELGSTLLKSQGWSDHTSQLPNKKYKNLSLKSYLMS